MTILKSPMEPLKLEDIKKAYARNIFFFGIDIAMVLCLGLPALLHCFKFMFKALANKDKGLLELIDEYFY